LRKRSSSSGGGRSSVCLRLEFSKPFCTPGEELGCRLLINTERPLRYKAVSAELTCCEKFFIKGSRLTRTPHRHTIEISGPGLALPPRKSFYFSIVIPRKANPTYIGSSILRIWRVKASVELGLAPDISVEEALFIVGSIGQEGQRSASSFKDHLHMDIHLKKGLCFPGEILEGSVLLSHPTAVRSLRVEIFAIEKLCVEPLGEISLARSLRRAVLPVKKVVSFALQAPNYSSFIDVCSSATYVLKATASLRAGGELVVRLPISIGVLRTCGTGRGIPRVFRTQGFKLFERTSLGRGFTRLSPLSWS